MFVVIPSHGEAERSAVQFRLLPLRAHLLRAAKAPELDCKLKDADVRRIAGKINGIWKPAGIQFYLDSIVSEEAAAQELYKNLDGNRDEAQRRIVRPGASRSDQMVHVYYIREMNPNGICLLLNYQLIFVKDTARLNPVEGGIDEPLPRVSAHEIGHALGLPHRQNRTNLMASGTTGTSLNDAEIETARKTAAEFKWSLTPKDALTQATNLIGIPDAPRGREILTVLATLPKSDISDEARERLKSR